MATNFYDLHKPWSSIRVRRGETHTKIFVWESGGLAGSLTVRNECARDAILSFANHEGEAICFLSYRGAEVGTGVTILREPRSRSVVNEYGDTPTTLEDLKKEYPYFLRPV